MEQISRSAGDGRRTKIIVALVGVTAVAAAIFIGARLSGQVGPLAAPETVGVQVPEQSRSTLDRLSTIPEGTPTADIAALVEEIRPTLGERDAVLLVEALLRVADPKTAQTAAVLLAESAGKAIPSPRLVLRAGAEYELGRFVEQDRQRALDLLTLPAMAEERAALLAAGEIYLDPEFSGSDEEMGWRLIEKSAGLGYAPAQARLDQRSAGG